MSPFIPSYLGYSIRLIRLTVIKTGELTNSIDLQLFWVYHWSFFAFQVQFVVVSGQCPQSRNRIMCFLFSLNYLRFPLTKETDPTKKPSNFAKLQFLTDNIDQSTNFAKLWLWHIWSQTHMVPKNSVPLDKWLHEYSICSEGQAVGIQK